MCHFRNCLRPELRTEIFLESRTPSRSIPGIVIVLLKLTLFSRVHMVRLICRVRMMRMHKARQGAGQQYASERSGWLFG